MTKRSQSIWLFFFFYFSKAFWYNLLQSPSGLDVQNMDRQVHNMLDEQLADRLGSKVRSSSGYIRPAISGVLWGSILGSVLRNVFINYLDARVECTVHNLRDDIKLEVISSLLGREALQRYA